MLRVPSALPLRIAGAIFVTNAALALIGCFARQMMGPVPIVVALADLALGASLLGGFGWTTLAILRCLFGAVVLTGVAFVDGRVRVLNGDWAAAATEALFSIGLMSLLIGRPGKLRLVIGPLLSLIAVVDRLWYVLHG
jgi:hypothetical protein